MIRLLLALLLLATPVYAGGINNPVNAPPSGAAGGDLAGTYPNPTVASIGGKAVTLGGALTTSGGFGTTLTATGTTSITLPPSGTLAILDANTFTGAETFSLAPAISQSAISLTGTPQASGNGTTNFPLFFANTSGASAATTWSTAGTFIGINGPNGFSGHFLNFRANGASAVFSVNANGEINGSARMNFNTQSAYNLAAWTTTGAGFKIGAVTWTDTSSSGTIAAEYVHVFNAPTLAFSSATTVTNAYNTYFVDPVQGTNATLTAKYAIGADSLRISGAGFNAPGLGTSSAATSGTLCWTTGTGLVNVDTTVACLASDERLKDIRATISPIEGLRIVSEMQPLWFTYKPSFAKGDPGLSSEQPGFTAQRVAKVDRRLAAYADDGMPRGVRYQEYAAVLTAAIQELKADNDNLRARIAKLEAR